MPRLSSCALAAALLAGFAPGAVFAQCNGAYAVSYDSSAAQATYTLSASGECSVAVLSATEAWWQSGHVIDYMTDGQTSVARTLQMDTACLADGTYNATFGAHCGKLSGSDCPGQNESPASRVFTVDNTPSVSVTAGPRAGTTLYDVTLSYNFPNTRAPDSSQRFLSLTHIDTQGQSSTVWDSTNLSLPAQSGSISFTIETSCWAEGAHQLKPVATHACARSTKEGAPQTIAIQRKPVLSVTPTKNPDGSTHLSIHYQFFDTAGRTVTLELLSTPTQAGGELAEFIFLPMQGTIETNVPLDPRPLARITALNGNCYSTDTTVGVTSNSCCPGGPPGWVGNPIRLWNGAVAYSEHDPLPDDLGLVFQRTYRSDSRTPRAFGVGWLSSFDGGIAVADAARHKSVVVYTDGNERVLFDQLPNGAWLQTWPGGVASRGTLSGSESAGYSYREPGSSIVRLYGGAGNHHLLGIKDLRTGRQVTIAYNASGDPATVEDSFGAWSCTVTTDANHRVTQIAVDGRPDLVWNYGYDGDRNLLTVTLAGAPSAWRTYGYVQVGAGWYLASVADALGHVFEQHAYDASGRATTSIGPAGDITNVQYNNASPSTTVVTRADNSTSTYTQVFVDREVTSQVAGGCAACGGHDLTAAYDAFGHVWRVQDGRGYVTESLYDQTANGPRNLISETRALRPAGCDPATDLGHCALSSSDLAAATLAMTAASRTTTYAYADPNWPDRPTQVSRDSVLLPGQFVVESFTYDAVTGQTLTHTTTGATGATPHMESHTATTALCNGAEVAAFDPGGTFNASWLALPQPAGMTKSVRGPRTDVDDTTLFVYYPIGSSAPATARGRLAAVKNALGHVTRYGAYDLFGHATTITDPNGVTTELTYDALGRVLTSAVRGVPGCDTSLDALCASDLVTTMHYANGTGPLDSTMQPSGSTTSFTYDSRGRMSSYRRGLQEQIVFTYDPATQKKASESYQALENGVWSEKRRESYTYDNYGRLARTTHADNSAVVYSYDEGDDLAGVQDERHASANTRYEYDGARRLTKVTQTLGGGTIATSYGYDSADDLVSVTDPNGNVTTYVYDDFGRMLQQTSPVTGVTTYAYDAAGDLSSMTDANGATTTRTYDAVGRLLTAVSACTGSDTEQVIWAYDDPSTGKFGIGRVASMTDPSGSTSYAYERRGLLRNEDRMIGSWSSATPYAYDANGNRTQLGTLYYTYDAANRQSAVTGRECAGCPALPIVTSASYLPFGPETQTVFGNGTQQTKSYDSRYQIVENKLTGPGAVTVADYTYAPDAAGNIIAIYDVTNSSFDRTFAYDDLSRLTTANTGTGLWGTGSYAYDSMGNLASATIGQWNESSTFVGTTPILATTTSGQVGYDAAGNELNSTEAPYPPVASPSTVAFTRQYSCRNLLSVVDAAVRSPGSGNTRICPPFCSPPPPRPTVTTEYSYSYDGRGVRVHMDASDGRGADYVYTPELSLARVHSSSSGEDTEFAWLNGRPIAQISTQWSAPRFTFTDHLGTPLLQTDSAAQVVWRAEYEPYGRIYTLRNGTADEQPLRFPGQDAAAHGISGVEENYNIYRWYRAGWGRYTQADPLAVDAFTPERERMRVARAVYEYAFDNPLRYVDPLGLQSCPGNKCGVDCPGGDWVGVGANSSAGLLFGKSSSLSVLFCTSSGAYCHFSSRCTTVGIQAGASTGVSFYGYTGCKCIADIIAMTSLSFGPVSLHAASNCVGLAYGVGYGVGSQTVVGSVCTTKLLGCVR